MRTYEEVKADIDAAVSIDDGDALRRLGQEMQAIDAPTAQAVAYTAFGIADKLIGDYDSALDHYDRSLELYEKLCDRMGVARVTSNIGGVYDGKGDFPRALEHYERALQLSEELGDDASVARVTGNMAIVHYHLGNFQKAQDGLMRAITLHEAVGNRASVARVSGNLGSVHARIGNYHDALEQFSRALELHEELGNRDGAASVIGNMGNVYSRIGDFRSALEHFSRSLAITEELGDRSGEAILNDSLGILYSRAGSYPQAMEHYRRALAIHEEHGNRNGIATVTCNLGLLYQSTGDPAMALEQYRQALTLYDQVGNRAGVAIATGNIGVIHVLNKEYALALELYQQAVALHEELGDRPGVSRVTGNIIGTLLELEEYEQAEQHLDHHAAILNDDPSVLAEYHAHRARLAEHTGDYDAALASLNESLSIATKAGIREQAALAHERLREFAQKRNDLASYVEHNAALLQITEEIRGREATQRLAMMEAERAMEAERREREKERALLYGALPERVAIRMLRGDDVSGDQYDHVAVLFLDIAGFTAHSSKLQPQQTTKILDELFLHFDDLCARHDVTKIKTIGDSYMAVAFGSEEGMSVGGLEVEQRTVNAALGMIASSFTWPDGSPLRFRVGLHCGPVVAGVIGKERLQYDVWGDTVNVASRMESTGEPGRIQVSSEFHEQLSSRGSSNYRTVERGVVEIKGKGAMITYWLEEA